MKAAIYIRRSSGKCLELVDIGPPVPRKNEVLIKTHASSVNPLDWRLKSRRPGVDVAGEIVSVGTAVTRFKDGDKVFGAGRGSFAEYVCATESKVVSKPDNITFEDAASIPSPVSRPYRRCATKVDLRRGTRYSSTVQRAG
jgi:NADPH:quinone reductase-like Zn-dependent oxidoreductase